MSPTQRTLKLLRDANMTAQVVERWNAYAKVRVDLFGVIDVVALDPAQAGVLGVQATSGTNHAARRAKLLASPLAQLWVRCGNRLWLVSWRKLKRRWEPRVEEIYLGHFTEDAA